MRWALLLVCGVIAIAQADLGIGDVQEVSESNQKDIISNKSPIQKEKILFFASTLTTTFMTLSMITSIIPYTCFTATNNQACQGKKKRSLLKLDGHQDWDFQLEPSLEKKDIDIVDLDAGSDAGKLLFTVWRTSFSTKTKTTFSINRDVSVSIRLACTIAGVETGVAPACAGK